MNDRSDEFFEFCVYGSISCALLYGEMKLFEQIFEFEIELTGLHLGVNLGLNYANL